MIRLFDILFSLLGIIILFPLFLIIYSLVIIESKGGGFYTQNRVGKNGVDHHLRPANPFTRIYSQWTQVKIIPNSAGCCCSSSSSDWPPGWRWPPSAATMTWPPTGLWWGYWTREAASMPPRSDTITGRSGFWLCRAWIFWPDIMKPSSVISWPDF